MASFHSHTHFDFVTATTTIIAVSAAVVTITAVPQSFPNKCRAPRFYCPPVKLLCMAMMANLKHKQRTHEYNSIEPYSMANFADAIKRRFRFNMNLNYDYQRGK